MKLANLILATWLVSLAPLFGQVNAVNVEVTLEQDQFLPDEDLRVAVKVTNHSGQTLKLGKDADWLTFSLESRDNQTVPQLGIAPVAGEFSLESSLAGTKRINLTPYFNFSRPGGYRVVATVKIPQWNGLITAKSKMFEVVSGTRLRDIEFGVPPDGNSATSPEVRHYILQQAVYMKHMRLYVRLTDASGVRTLKLHSLAQMTSFTKPEAQLDKFSNLHVLTQTGARSFMYVTINPDGQILSRETHDYADSRPVLKFNAEGRVRVFGGVRRITQTDIPAPQEAVTQNNVTTQQ